MISFNEITTKVNSLIRTIESEFVSRTEIEGRRSGKDFKNVKLNTTIENKVINFTIKTDESTHTITVPVPFYDNGILFIKKNQVKRVVCNHFDVKADKEIDYISAIRTIFMGDFTGL